MRTILGRSRTHGVAVALAAAGAILGTAAAQDGRAARAASDVRALPEFDRVAVHGGLDATVVAGAPRDRVVIRGATGSVGRVTTEVRDGTLSVSVARGARGMRPQIEIAVPVLRGLHADGDAVVRAAGVAGTDLQIESGGASRLVVAGRVALESVSADGTSTLDATRLDATDAAIDASGSATVRVRCSGTLSVAFDGAASVRWLGRPWRYSRSSGTTARLRSRRRAFSSV